MNTVTLTDLQSAFASSLYGQAEAFLEYEIEAHAIRAVRRSLPIEECHESLVAIPGALVLADPHPYAQAGAPYGTISPWRVRESVAHRLSQAQTRLSGIQPGFKIFVFDAFRPVSVQAYMIEHECDRLAHESTQQAFETLDAKEQADVRAQVMQFWAAPNDDPTAPPPHATGAAVDVTLLDGLGQAVPMGTDIDDFTEKAYPSYFKNRNATFHANRLLLNDIMQQSGFHRNPVEWWHFSYGDQAWTVVEALEKPTESVTARYGRVC